MESRYPDKYFDFKLSSTPINGIPNELSFNSASSSGTPSTPADSDSDSNLSVGDTKEYYLVPNYNKLKSHIRDKSHSELPSPKNSTLYSDNECYSNETNDEDMDDKNQNSKNKNNNKRDDGIDIDNDSQHFNPLNIQEDSADASFANKHSLVLVGGIRRQNSLTPNLLEKHISKVTEMMLVGSEFKSFSAKQKMIHSLPERKFATCFVKKINSMSIVERKIRHHSLSPPHNAQHVCSTSAIFCTPRHSSNNPKNTEPDFTNNRDLHLNHQHGKPTGTSSRINIPKLPKTGTRRPEPQVLISENHRAYISLYRTTLIVQKLNDWANSIHAKKFTTRASQSHKLTKEETNNFNRTASCTCCSDKINIHLLDAKLYKGHNSHGMYELYIEVEDSIWVLYMTSSHERKQWMKAIKSALEYKIENFYLVSDMIIGTGSFGTVTLASSLDTVEVVAVKDIKKSQLNDKDTIATEAKILQILNHRNIVHIFDIFETKDNYYVVMEWLSGGDLYDRIISAKQISERRASIIMQEIFEGLAYLHANGIIHRDMKPENLLCTSRDWPWHVKISDFGLATHVDALIHEKEKVGTTAFIAPEVLENDTYTYAADMWACGVILYQMIAGRFPFCGTEEEIMRKTVRDDVEFPALEWKCVSRDCIALVMRLLEKDPRRRLSAKEALSQRWIKTNADKKDISIGNNVTNIRHNNLNRSYSII